MLNAEGNLDLERAKILDVPDLPANRGGIIHVDAETPGLDAAETEQPVPAAIARTASLSRDSQKLAGTPWDIVVAFATARTDGARATTGATV